MSDYPTFEEFKAFVNSQDKSRIIDHSGWDVCAVGLFLDYLGGRQSIGVISVGEMVNHWDFPLICNNKESLTFKGAIQKEFQNKPSHFQNRVFDKSLDNLLGNGRHYVECETFGQLSQALSFYEFDPEL